MTTVKFSGLGVVDDWTTTLGGVLRGRREFKRWLGQRRAEFYRLHRTFLNAMWPNPSRPHRKRIRRMAGK